jgi:hypothetical protein
MILCVEGASAAGKTTLADALAREAGATNVPELDATGAPPVAESAAWYVERHVEQWQRARAAAAVAPLVVLDGDPFKGLWYNWVFGDAGWPGVDVVAPLYQRHVARGDPVGKPVPHPADAQVRVQVLLCHRLELRTEGWDKQLRDEQRAEQDQRDGPRADLQPAAIAAARWCGGAGHLAALEFVLPGKHRSCPGAAREPLQIHPAIL